MSQTIDYHPSPAPLPPMKTSTLGWWVGAATMLIALVVARWFTGNFVVDVVQGVAVDGAILLLYLAAAFGWGCRFVVAPALTTDDSQAVDDHPIITGMQIVTAIAIGLGMMSTLILALGLAGLFNFHAALGLIGVGLLLGALWLRKAAGAGRTFGIDRAAIWWMLPLGFVLALALVCASIAPGFLWKPLDPHPYDVLSYHLQIPREWYDAGRIIPLQHNAFSYFPMAMEMHDLAAMHLRGGPWAGMYLCQFFSLAHGVLTVIAVAQIARALGATTVRAWSAAMAIACVPWMFQLATVAYVEPGLMLYTTLAAGWGLVAIRTGGTRVDTGVNTRALVLVGVLAGLACGMKYTALVMTAAPVCVITAVLAARRGTWWRAVVLPGACCAIVASPWLVRNTFWTGNPVFPLATGVFGQAHFQDDQVERYRVAHRPVEGETSLTMRGYNGWMRTVRDWQYGYLFIPAGVLALGAMGLRPGGSRSDAGSRRTALFLGSLVLVMLLVWIGATHVIPRFISPVVPLLGLALALAPVPAAATLAVSILQSALGLLLLLGWLDRGWAIRGAPKAAEELYPFELGRSGGFRLNDLKIFETQETQAARESQQKIALIGDAQAFFYVVPSERLIYRSVFDVHVPPGTSLVDGWVGEPIDSLRKRGVWVVINTSELNRLSQTYRGLPRPAAPWDQVVPVPIVLPPLAPPP